MNILRTNVVFSSVSEGSIFFSSGLEQFNEKIPASNRQYEPRTSLIRGMK